MSGLLVPGPKGLIVPEHVAKAAAKAKPGISHGDMVAFGTQVVVAMAGAGLVLGGYVPKPPEGIVVNGLRLNPETRELTGQVSLVLTADNVAAARGRAAKAAKEAVQAMLDRLAEADEQQAREHANPQLTDQGGEG